MQQRFSLKRKSINIQLFGFSNCDLRSFLFTVNILLLGLNVFFGFGLFYRTSNWPTDCVKLDMTLAWNFNNGTASEYLYCQEQCVLDIYKQFSVEIYYTGTFETAEALVTGEGMISLAKNSSYSAVFSSLPESRICRMRTTGIVIILF